MNNNPQFPDVREVLQLLVRRFGLLQKDGAHCCGISVIQSHIIYELMKHPNIALNDLAQTLFTDTSTISRQIQQLVELEMVRRTPDPKDRRYVVLSLTSKGEEQHQAISKTMENYVQGILQLIPENKRDQVVESLGLLSQAMNQNENCCSSS
ncbi:MULTISPECIES: MarR family winged helix-turn-helix transcriptional regulator [unclassified Paenibacillus]|uniref:MarR family winged helix-turn-helix transcriptional regulator n=1 Tax=unclassified Paenibacillus TaxID=185978 RepID=UPI0007092954|nr:MULTISPECIES: MarR family winged helix-turn-helix transcriptional regulator [unclassified Paenibacillus]KQX67234.1 MarR family transcriptional regulator [Paenibacillus sp. Root444D2]KRE50000.1 MarR family transcriptional regulator [Paenibacillus sp. Soil724D2]